MSAIRINNRMFHIIDGLPTAHHARKRQVFLREWTTIHTCDLPLWVIVRSFSNRVASQSKDSLGRRIGIGNRTFAVHYHDAIRDRLNNAFQTFLIHLKLYFGTLAFGDLCKENCQPIVGWIDAVLKPAIPRSIVILELNESLRLQRARVGFCEGGSFGFGEFLPVVPADQVFRFTSEQLATALIDVGIVHLSVKRYKPVADPFKDISNGC